MACHLPASRCPAAHPGICPACSVPLSTSSVGYHEVTAADGEPPAETWAAPGHPPLNDPYGHPLTWGSVLAAHADLVRHASHSSDQMAANGYDSDEAGEHEICPCQYHDALISELETARDIVATWPSPLCGACFASACHGCDYVFTDASEAAGRSSAGRLVCHSPACAWCIAGPA